MNAYEILGKWGTKDGKPLPRDSDKVTIKKAYKRAAMKAHPDRHGGDLKAMIEVNQANDILSDPERRARHDLGEDDEPKTPPFELRARMVLAQAFMKAAMSPVKRNYVSLAKESLIQLASKASQDIVGIRSQLVMLESRIKDVSFEPSESNPVNVWSDQITQSIEQLKHALEKAQEDIKVIDRARDLLVAYKCHIPELGTSPFSSRANWTSF